MTEPLPDSTPGPRGSEVFLAYMQLGDSDLMETMLESDFTFRSYFEDAYGEHLGPGLPTLKTPSEVYAQYGSPKFETTEVHFFRHHKALICKSGKALSTVHVVEFKGFCLIYGVE